MQDIVIVGSGLSGAAVAAELAGTGADFLVLEGGSDAGNAHIGSDPASAGLVDPGQDPWFRPFLDRNSSAWGYGPGCGYRARLGGRGLYWRGICLRIEPDVLAGWPDPVRDALPELYEQVEEHLTAWTGRPSLHAARTRTEDRMVAGLSAHGYPAVPTPRAVRDLGGGRWEAYRPVVAVPRDRMRTGYRVTQVRQRARGGYALTTAGGTTVEARRVVLGTGTFGNVQLVDGLRPEAGGYRLYDHVALGLLVVEPDAEHEAMDSSVHAGFHPAARSNLVVERRRDRSGVLLDAWAMGEQPPAAATTVTVRPDLRVWIGAQATELLLEVYREQQALLAGLADRLGVATVNAREPTSFDEALELARNKPGTACYYRAHLGELDHECGALPLGGSQVDPTGRLSGTEGVFVAGPCLFPRAGAANPTLTTLALARYIARQLT